MDGLNIYTSFFTYWGKPELRRFYVRKYFYIKTLMTVYSKHLNKLDDELITAFDLIDPEKLEELNYYWDRWGVKDDDSSENIVDKDKKDRVIYWQEIEQYLESIYNILEQIFLLVFNYEMKLGGKPPHPDLSEALI